MRPGAGEMLEVASGGVWLHHGRGLRDARRYRRRNRARCRCSRADCLASPTCRRREV